VKAESDRVKQVMATPLSQVAFDRPKAAMPRDPMNYGFGPQASYFGNNRAPSTGLPGAGYAKGGAPRGGALSQAAMPSRYVSGPGSGRDDLIPAALSDGEYVLDAQSVALIGDGSSKEGARRLDKFRENVRRHKGKAMAKGKFGPDAKDPMQYLSGA
jgi:hypothetical protein